MGMNHVRPPTFYHTAQAKQYLQRTKFPLVHNIHANPIVTEPVRQLPLVHDNRRHLGIGHAHKLGYQRAGLNLSSSPQITRYDM
jgi:hypothetical protein